MDIDEALMAYLKAHSGLTALVGNIDGTKRIFFAEAPQNTPLPYVVIIDVSNVIEGDLNGQLDVEMPNKQLTAYATTRAGAKAVAKQIRAACDDYHGTISGVVVQHMRLMTDLTTEERSADGTVRVHMTDLEYEITYVKE